MLNMNQNPLTNRSGVKLKSRLNGNIGQWLYLAFGAIVTLTLLTSLLTLYSFNRFGVVVHSTSIETIPLIVSAGRLSERSQSLAASAPIITLARDEAELHTIQDNLKRQLREINRALDDLVQHMNLESLNTIRQEVDALSETFTNLESLSATRIKLNHSREQTILRLDRIRADLADHYQYP